MLSPCKFFILMGTTKNRSPVCVCEFEGLMKSALIKQSWGKCFKIANQLNQVN